MMSRGKIILLAAAILLVSAAAAVVVVIVNVETVGYKAPLVISVQAFYPGANAQVVADTVAAPIEQQVNGVEHMLTMTSQSANDGSYTLHIWFEAGTDLDLAQVLLQNRVSLAMPIMPALVQKEGISVRKKSPHPLVLVSLTSPDHHNDAFYLSNYATINVKDEIGRVPGVGEVVLFGRRDYALKVELDADKLKALDLSAMDVVTAIKEQNLQVATGLPPVPKGQQFQLTIQNTGRLTDPEEYGDIIVKATADGRIVRLNDVARVEMASSEKTNASANFNGQAAVLLGIYPLPDAKPSEVSRAVANKLAQLRGNVPAGLALTVAFDFAANLEQPTNPATPEYLVIDAELPESASAERTAETLAVAAKLLQKTPGVQDVLAMTEHPFCLVRDRPCLIVRLTAKDQRQGREQVAAEVRSVLHDHVAGAAFRLSLPSAAEGFPVYGYPIDFVIEYRGAHGSATLWDGAAAVVEKMNQSNKFSDAGIGTGLRPVPALYLDIDRTKCVNLGVDTSEIFNTLQLALGSYYVNDINQFGRSWQVHVQGDPRFRDRTANILNLQVKNKQNQLVRLGAVMDVRESLGPKVIERHNMYPSARITANLAEGAPRAEAKLLCERLAEKEFSTKDFRLVWQMR
jgi:multidrug efflux pump subunit AcrB